MQKYKLIINFRKLFALIEICKIKKIKLKTKLITKIF